VKIGNSADATTRTGADCRTITPAWQLLIF
jgi:hypothetical protein